jgi:hypothetical protein
MNDVFLPMRIEPQWFLALFGVMWLGITGLLAHLSGWARLAARFRASEPPNGERFRFASGSLGAKMFPVNYGGCLFVAVSGAGVHFSILFLFRFQSPPLFIPWSQIESVDEKCSLLSQYTVIRVRGEWPIISLRGRAGQFVKEAYAQALSQRVL